MLYLPIIYIIIIEHIFTSELAAISVANNCGKTDIISLLRAVKFTVRGIILHPTRHDNLLTSTGSCDCKIKSKYSCKIQCNKIINQYQKVHVLNISFQYEIKSKQVKNTFASI